MKWHWFKLFLKFRYILCTPLHRIISKGRFTYHYVKRSTSRGKLNTTLIKCTNFYFIKWFWHQNWLIIHLSSLGVDQRLCDSFCRRCRLLSCVKRNSLSGQCWKCASFHSPFGANHSQKYSWNQKFAWNFEWPRKYLRLYAGTIYFYVRKSKELV